MKSFEMDSLVTYDNFDENNYLNSNPDIKKAVKDGKLLSGYQHFDIFGHTEQRYYRNSASIKEAKKFKMERIKPLLRNDLPFIESDHYYDFLSDYLKKEFNIHDTDTISCHQYDQSVQFLIEEYSDGLILDVGAGKRPVYYSNVVNLEITAYDTTDVLCVGEVLPFCDDSFDAVISVAVLEHVKNPFSCAREIARVLKPGGKLICAVPFLQPLHGYPNHYYNMTAQGLENLFENLLVIDQILVVDSLLPIYALSWILKSWTEGLQGIAKEEFLCMHVKDLIDEPFSYLKRDFVRNLSITKNDELASGHTLFAHKSLL